MALPRVQVFSSTRTRCICRSDPVLRMLAPPRRPVRNCAEANFAMSSTVEVMPVAAAMPLASMNGVGVRVVSGVRRL